MPTKVAINQQAPSSIAPGHVSGEAACLSATPSFPPLGKAHSRSDNDEDDGRQLKRGRTDSELPPDRTENLGTPVLTANTIVRDTISTLTKLVLCLILQQSLESSKDRNLSPLIYTNPLGNISIELIAHQFNIRAVQFSF